MIRIIGFVGVECYDLIHLLSKVITTLGASCLVIDNSDTKALSCSVPGGLTAGNCSYYHGVDFIADISLRDNTDTQSYDYVLIDFGFSNDADMKLCDEVTLVTDFQIHNLERLKQIDVGDVYRNLVLRDRVSSKLKPEYAISELSMHGITSENTILLEESQQDLENRLLCQYNNVFNFKQACDGMRVFVESALVMDYSVSQIKSAYKTVSRRMM